MRFAAPFAMTSALGLVAGLMAYGRYRRDIKEMIERVEHGASIADTPTGMIEYGEAGDGEPLLLIHGAGGGYDQGLLIGRDFKGFRIIAPSRFGYLGMPVPEDASPAAQAEIHAALLEHLGIDKCVVVGVSAGGPSAIEFALRYPDRTSALILLVPRTYDPTNAVGVDERLLSQMVLRLVESSSDFAFWLAIKLARSAVVRFLGVPPELEARAPAAERARVTAVMRSILPLSRRVAGIVAEGNGPVGPWPLERMRVPTLVVSAKDDLFDTLPGARYTAEHIAGAELKVLESGGHLMLGHTEQVQRWVGDFLARSRTSTYAGDLEPA